MPRTDPTYARHAVRAYHRASAALRDQHREEWEALRAQFLEIELDSDTLGSPGPARGRRPLISPYRKATVGDMDEARRIITAAMAKSKATEKTVLTALTKAGFLLMRSTATR